MTLGKYILPWIFLLHIPFHLSFSHKVAWENRAGKGRRGPSPGGTHPCIMWRWQTDAGKQICLLYPADICLSPCVCSCTDQIVEDVSQMLDCLPTRPSNTRNTVPWLFFFVWECIRILTNKSHTFGSQTANHRSSSEAKFMWKAKQTCSLLRLKSSVFNKQSCAC